MALSLRDVHYIVRSQIGELEENRWTDAFINFCINTRAQDFCMPAGLSTFYTSLPVNDNQEAVLPVDLDTVKTVKYFAGQLFPLTYHEWDDLQTGAFVGSI